MSMSDLKIEIAERESVHELRELWLALHHHHLWVASLLPLVADDEASWHRRRALYAESLLTDRGFLAIATKHDRRAGYAMVRIEQGPDDTWHVNEQYAELYSLSVALNERGHGIGGALFEAVESELSRRGITDLVVAVMTGSDCYALLRAARPEAGRIALLLI
jgi:ribosomal protein S18 acetylase RimI-like enzyme